MVEGSEIMRCADSLMCMVGKLGPDTRLNVAVHCISMAFRELMDVSERDFRANATPQPQNDSTSVVQPA
jgi:hypothetical protein